MKTPILALTAAIALFFAVPAFAAERMPVGQSGPQLVRADTSEKAVVTDISAQTKKKKKKKKTSWGG